MQDFHACRYARCLRALEAALPALRLDLQLSAHVDTLFKQVGRGGVWAREVVGGSGVHRGG